MWNQVVPVVKNLPANTGDTRDLGLIPGSGRSPQVGNGNPLQYSCLLAHTHAQNFSGIPHTHVWNLKYNTNGPTYETETQSQTQRTGL